MKANKLIGLCLLMVLLTFNVQAQVHQGVYLSVDDYIANKIIPDTGLCKIQANSIFKPNKVCLTIGHKKYKYCKDSLYAYVEAGIMYRVNHSDKRDYRVREQGVIIIYTVNEPEYGYKNIKLVPQYYFSVNLSSGIIPLSLINIKKAFPDAMKLHHYLDMEFYRQDVTAYNEAARMYHINYLLKQLNEQL